MENRTFTLLELLQKSDAETLLLPNFQRDYVWSRNAQKTLIASVLLGYPMGSLLILEGAMNEFASRELCLITPKHNESTRDCFYLLDGQQRISTLKAAFTGIYNKTSKENMSNLFSLLQHNWVLSFNISNGAEDLFGIENLAFNKKEFLASDIKDIEQAIISIKSKNLKPKELAKKYYLPLYALLDKENESLYEKTLMEIGECRINELIHEPTKKQLEILLKAEIHNEKELKLLFKNKESSNIEESMNARMRIHQAYQTLSMTWQTELRSFFASLKAIVVPAISLNVNERSKAFPIFEVINKGGTKLDEYDLVVAKAARHMEDQTLTEIILNDLNNSFEVGSLGHHTLSSQDRIKPNVFGFIENEKTLHISFKNPYKALISIFKNQKEDAKIEYTKRNFILNMEGKDIFEQTPSTVQALSRAMAFLNLRCGVAYIKDLHYKLMIIPIAYLLHHDKVWNDVSSLNKIEYWYWAAYFSGRYRMNQNRACIEDANWLRKWILEDNAESQAAILNMRADILKVPKYNDLETLLLEHGSCQKAVEHSILQYILSLEPRDFQIKDAATQTPRVKLAAWKVADCIEGKDQDQSLEIHHIFPLSRLKDLKMSKATADLRSDRKNRINSPLNLIYISQEINQKISNMLPSTYFRDLNEASLEDHLIPEAFKNIKEGGADANQEEIKAAFEARYNLLLKQLNNELDELLSI